MVKCPECGVSVEEHKIMAPNRCHANCPLTQMMANRSHGLPGCCGMNWTEDDKRRDPNGWARHLASV